MKAKQLLTLLLMAVSITAWGTNKKESVTQVTTSITVNADVDYVVTDATPFADDGVVNLANTTHAVLIIEKVKPSQVISTLLAKRVKIKGAVARNNVNCQVRLYGSYGSMILPYSSSDKPLTTYTEPSFKGDSCTNYDLGNDGGYMQTLTDQQLNNRIRSFRLKRGYMVTFATQKSGYGYQRCFIANDADVEFANLPKILDSKITSYRIFKWNTAGKKGMASSTDSHLADTLNVISCYGWDVGKDMQPDVECVANHLYEDYPSSSACGKATWTSHMKTNNEPRNNSDDKPQSLETILGNWQNLMRTGMRLCSPSSWDGSDYTDGSGFLNSFFQAIDARGWRCDIADLHCYWLVDVFDKIPTMQAKYKRPIWVSEWIWGASWNKNGAFESGKTDWDNEWAVKTICGKMNNMECVERYFYWNSETKAKLNNGNDLTPAGKWYASQQTGMGYKSKFEKIPEIPPMTGGFDNFRVTQEGTVATITWHEFDGEYNQLMELLRKEPGKPWQHWKTITPEDAEADYAVVDSNAVEGVRYRLHITSYSGREYYSSEDLEPGEAVEVGGKVKYAGGNVIDNGDFQMGMKGWTSGTGEPLAQPWFGVYPKGLTDGYFLQALADQGKENVGSILTAFDIVPNQDYLFRLGSCNAGEYIKVDVRTKGATGDSNKATLKSSSYWATQSATFNSGDNNEALLAFRWLGGKGQLSDIELCRLFETYDEAIADGIAMARKRAETVKAYNTVLPLLNTELDQKLSAINTTNSQALADITIATDNVLKALIDFEKTDSLLTAAKAVVGMDFEGREALQEAISQASDKSLLTTTASITAAKEQLQKALANFLTLYEAAQQPQSPDFNDTEGWQTKVGTETKGDQRTTTKEDKTCWNAWWSGHSASEGTAASMAITQKIGGLAEGLYSLECKATTEHYCLSDQHGFIATATDTAVTPMLAYDYLDIPNTKSSWQTLTTTPIYVNGTDTVTIGFIGTKQGATDYAWRTYGVVYDNAANNKGDLREGWWCATDFRLLYHPLFKVERETEWSTICLPYAYRLPKGMKLYSVAGLLNDSLHICLEEVEQTEPGHPYICKTEEKQVTFYTYGEEVKMPVSRGTNNLRGYFNAIVDAPQGSYFLKADGEWHRLTDKRENPGIYAAVITKVEGMPMLESWTGETMRINGAKEELEANAINLPSAANAKDAKYYRMDGRSTSEPNSGLYIKKNGNETKKFIK